MKHLLAGIALTCALMALAPLASAQTAAVGTGSCRQLQDPSERLRCYDAQDAATQPSPPSAAPVVRTPSTAAPAAASATVVPAAPPSAAAPPAAKFGEENLPSKLRPAPAKTDYVLLASITRIDQVRPKVFNITLANGQVWRQEGTEATMFFRAGADARIEKGAFGDYRMSTSATGKALWVRVTRIQ